MRYLIQPAVKEAFVHKELYGGFAEHLGRCVYEGIFVGMDSPIPNVNGMRTDVVNALKRMRLSVLRWPGGCYADTYHWRDGVGDPAKRKKTVNSTWGGVKEDNSFGTHEFFELCRQVGCEPYVNGNVGTGSPQEMSEWIEYLNSADDTPVTDLRKANGQAEPWGLRYFAVGNENWGGGGNMTPEFYADMYRWYQTYLHPYGGKRVYRIACGSGQYAPGPNYEWTRVMMEKAARYMDGLSLHYYTWPYAHGEENGKGSATVFDEQEYYATLAKAYKMESLVRNHAAIMDLYDPDRRVGLIMDEWGTWYDPEEGRNPAFLYQQSTMRDAMVTALTMHIFHRHADRVRMANLAQLANVLQAVVLTDGEKMALTPTYHAMEMLAPHQDATVVHSSLATDTFTEFGLQTPLVTESATVDATGLLTVSIANMSYAESRPVEMRIDGERRRLVEARILAGDAHALNQIGERPCVYPAAFEGVTDKAEGASTEVMFTLPACSLLVLRFAMA
jgi:alpha-L-arabinofuranosidase